MEGHLALVTVTEVLDDVVRPLIGLAQQDTSRVLLVDHRAQLFEDLVGSRQVLAARSLGLDEVGDGVETETVDAQVHPESDGVEHLLHDPGLLEVEVGLVVEEAVPVELLALGVPRPVGVLGVTEDDASVRICLVGVGRRGRQDRHGRTETTGGNQRCGSSRSR